jgi:abortive infection bacteriophage resistance protein
MHPPFGEIMKYEKPALSFEEQADKLICRGLVADRDSLIARLKVTSYYWLSAYLYPFRRQEEAYNPGITLDTVLRLDAIESIEVQVRTQLCFHFAHAHGPFEYLNQSNFPNFDRAKDDFGRWQRKALEQMERGRQPKGREDFVLHYYQKYGDAERVLPI